MKLLLVVLSASSSLLLNSQNFDDFTFVTEKTLEFLIDDEFFEDNLADEYDVKSINHYRVEYDSNGKADTIKIVEWFFDELGQLIEKRDRFSSSNDSIYYSVKFNYSENNAKIDTIITNPYKGFTVLDGAYIPFDIRRYCVEFSRGKFETIEIDYFDIKCEPKSFSLECGYYRDLPAKFYKDMNEPREEVYIFEYEFYKKFKRSE